MRRYPWSKASAARRAAAVGAVAAAFIGLSGSVASAASVDAVEVSVTKGQGNTGPTNMVQAGDTVTASITSDGGALNNAFSSWFGCRPPALASPITPGVSIGGAVDVCSPPVYGSGNRTPTLSNGNTTSTTSFVVPAGTGANGPAGTVLAFQTTLQATPDKFWTGQIPVASSVTAQPTISTPPASQTVGAGSTATFTVAATGNNADANLQPVPVSHALTYEWEKSTDGGQSWVTVAGAASSSYTTPALALSDTGAQYRVTVTDTPTIPGQKIGLSTSPAWQTQDYLAWTTPASRTSSAAGLTVVAPPAAPTLTIRGGNGQVTVEFQAGTGGATPSGYRAEVVGDASKNCQASGGSMSMCTISGLTNGTTYTFTAKAFNGQGVYSASTAPSRQVTPDIPPSTPGKPTVVAGDGEVVVTFVRGSGGGVPDSWLARVVGNPSKSCSLDASAGSCTITGLTNGTSYSVQAMAFGGGAPPTSFSPASDPVTPTASASGGSGSGGSASENGTPASGSSSAGSSGTAAMSAAARSKMRVRARVKGQLKASPGGVLRVPLTCPRSVPDGCDADGVLTMTLPGQVRAEAGYVVNPFAARTGRQRELARFADVEIASGATTVVTVRIDPSTFSALRRARVTRVPVTLLTNNALAGAPPVRSVQRIWLAIPSVSRSIAVTG